MTEEESKKLSEVLKRHKTAIQCTIVDIRRISSILCIHKILMEGESKPSIEGQSKLNPTLKDVV